MHSYIVPVQVNIYCGHTCPVTTAIGHRRTLTACCLTGLTSFIPMGQGLCRLSCAISEWRGCWEGYGAVHRTLETSRRVALTNSICTERLTGHNTVQISWRTLMCVQDAKKSQKWVSRIEGQEIFLSGVYLVWALPFPQIWNCKK